MGNFEVDFRGLVWHFIVNKKGSIFIVVKGCRTVCSGASVELVVLWAVFVFKDRGER